MSRPFRDRTDAGRQLAARLEGFRAQSPVVLGLPRGGVVVAYEVALELDAPLDICVVRKIGAPDRPELGLGAVAEGGATYLDRDLIDRYEISDRALAELVVDKRVELQARVQQLRAQAAPLDVRGRTVLLVDDGIAMGGTARAAMQSLRSRGAARIVLTVPVGPSRAIEELRELADMVVCLRSETVFFGVGAAYDDFTPVEDDEVIALLRYARRAGRRSERVAALAERYVQIPLDLASSPGATLEGTLVLPTAARGLVIFAHGSGSSRKSPRNQQVAAVLQAEGFATLLIDLLTADEERVDVRTNHHRFDIPLLASRLLTATAWARSEPELTALPLGYFGASTGAAAALVAAAARPNVVRAVVSRGGRPDLALSSLGDVLAPTLFIVGGADADVLRVNREALNFLACETEVAVVHGATHLFQEPGTLEQVAILATRWFVDHLAAERHAATA